MKEDGSSFKIYRDSLEEAWRSPTYIKIRKQFLEGARPEMCERCFREEDSGLESARQGWNEKWMDPNRTYSENDPLEVSYVDIRLGNLCNLKCRMCNPYSSNQWVKEWDLVSEPLSQEEKERLQKMTWVESEKTWENLREIGHSVEEIYLTGGEPTLILQQHKLLKYFIEAGLSSRIKLKYNTNATNVPHHLLDLWKQFRTVQLNCSIDGYGSVSEYIRYPSDWETIEKNIEILSQFDNVKIDFHFTVQIYNVLRIDEFLLWARKWERIKIYFNILNHPAHLNIRCLPSSLKTLASERLKEHLDQPKIDGVLKYMNHEDWSELWPVFQSFTRTLDNKRKQNAAEINPELSPFL